MDFHIITIFPEMISSYFKEGVLTRALSKKLVKIETHDLRNWTEDRHRKVDDAPYGGGAGMVMKIEPLFKAIKALKLKSKKEKLKTKIILLSAKGKRWNQQLAKKYSKLDNVILVCGRYEGVDERIKNFIDEEISIGDYVLTGGEIGALAVIDSVARLLPGALGNASSAEDESHSLPGVLEYPQYTRPEIFMVGKKKYRVPKTLLSGNHKEIEKWREEKRRKPCKDI